MKKFSGLDFGFLKRERLNPLVIFAVLVLLLGIGARLVWPLDIEYKGDEAWTFKAVINTQSLSDFPRHGMSSSVRIYNPGLSAWLPIVLGKTFQVVSPPDLARAYQILNILALTLVFFVPFFLKNKGETKLWLIAGMIASLNPFTILFHRKIWGQCLLPIFAVIFMISFIRREKAIAALFWGVMSGLMWQMHFSSLFMAAGFFIWVLLFDRKSANWPYYFVGGILGMIPSVSWVQYFLFEGGHSVFESYKLNVSQMMTLPFFRGWATDPLGTRLMYSLGDTHYAEFEKLPLIFGQETYMVRYVSHLLHLATLFLVGRLVFHAFKSFKGFKTLIQQCSGRGSESLFALSAAFFGAGLIMTLQRGMVHRHYFITFFPLTFLWMGWLILKTKRPTLWLGLFLASQAFLSFEFLNYLHSHCGAPGADYGVMYRCQQAPIE